MSALTARLAKIPQIVTILIVAALLAALVLVWPFGADRKTATVDFPRTTAVYVGSDVRVLGVTVGRVDSLEPVGDTVRATISYDADVDLPVDVQAVIVSPAIVGDRYVQMAPAYGGGETLADGATLDVDSTEVPVELDDVYSSLSDLSNNLGPEGLNDDGALAEFVEAQAELLDGRGEQINQTIGDLGDLSQVLSNNADPLFSSLEEVNEFVALLDRNDERVRAFNSSTAELATVLAEERQNLAETLAILGDTLVDVEEFVSANRDALSGNVENLTTVTGLLTKHHESVTELTVAAPVAYANLAMTYNPYTGTLDARADILQSLRKLLSTTTVCQVFADQVPDLPIAGDLLCDENSPLSNLGLPSETPGPSSGNEGSGEDEGSTPAPPQLGTPDSGDSAGEGVFELIDPELLEGTP